MDLDIINGLNAEESKRLLIDLYNQNLIDKNKLKDIELNIKNNLLKQKAEIILKINTKLKNNEEIYITFIDNYYDEDYELENDNGYSNLLSSLANVLNRLCKFKMYNEVREVALYIFNFAVYNEEDGDEINIDFFNDLTSCVNLDLIHKYYFEAIYYLNKFNLANGLLLEYNSNKYLWYYFDKYINKELITDVVLSEMFYLSFDLNIDLDHILNKLYEASKDKNKSFNLIKNNINRYNNLFYSLVKNIKDKNIRIENEEYALNHLKKDKSSFEDLYFKDTFSYDNEYSMNKILANFKKNKSINDLLELKKTKLFSLDNKKEYLDIIESNDSYYSNHDDILEANIVLYNFEELINGVSHFYIDECSFNGLSVLLKVLLNNQSIYQSKYLLDKNEVNKFIEKLNNNLSYYKKLIKTNVRKFVFNYSNIRHRDIYSNMAELFSLYLLINDKYNLEDRDKLIKEIYNQIKTRYELRKYFTDRVFAMYGIVI